LKQTLTIGFILLTFIGFGQIITEVDLRLVNKKYFKKGYDLVSYHQADGPVRGDKRFVTQYKSVALNFISQDNMDLFLSDPEMYMPKYGAWCAYGMAGNGKQFNVNPKAFEIVDGQLYLFYRKSVFNYLKRWMKKDREMLKSKADSNWEMQQRK